RIKMVYIEMVFVRRQFEALRVSVEEIDVYHPAVSGEVEIDPIADARSVGCHVTQRLVESRIVVEQDAGNGIAMSVATPQVSCIGHEEHLGRPFNPREISAQTTERLGDSGGIT